MTLLRRVMALERLVGETRQTCAVCGGPPPPGSYRLEFEREPHRGPERCPACGRQLVFRLEFDRAG